MYELSKSLRSQGKDLRLTNMEHQKSSRHKVPAAVQNFDIERKKLYGACLVAEKSWVRNQLNMNQMISNALGTISERIYGDNMIDFLSAKVIRGQEIPTDLSREPKSINDDIRHEGKIFRATGEFRAPRIGEYWLTPKNLDVYGPLQGQTGLSNVNIQGYKRIILGVLRSTLLNKDLVLEVLLSETEVSIKCNSCECDGTIGNIYFNRGSDINLVRFYHTGCSEPLAYYYLNTGLFKWGEDFDPEEVEVLSLESCSE